ncbi:hypothetical protein D3C77_200350 [compost metagenome]
MYAGEVSVDALKANHQRHRLALFLDTGPGHELQRACLVPDRTFKRMSFSCSFADFSRLRRSRSAWSIAI